MASKPLVFRFVLGIMLAASLACNAVTNLGRGSVGDAQETAESAMTEVFATANADATVDIGDPDDTDVPDDASTESPGDDGTDEPDDGTAEPNFEDAPEGVPVYQDGEVSDFFGSPELMSYFVDAEFEDVTTFYKDEMIANGWVAVSAASFEVEGLAIMSYDKDGRNAIITISPDPTSGRTTVLVGVTPTG